MTNPVARPEYAPNGLVGLLTPQANTTVEPEFSVLMPDGVAWLNGRLTSDGETIKDRLVDYMTGLDGATRQFGNAPIEALALGCTGTAYFVGAQQEDQMLDAVSQRLSIPVFSAATALVDALQVLKAQRIILVSPYTGDVDAACAPYWQSRGFDIASKIAATGEAGFHPIYAMHSDDASRALATVDTDGVDAIVILGTGLPTLPTLANLNHQFSVPVLSCMLALGWRTASALNKNEISAEKIKDWASGGEWATRAVRFRAGPKYPK